MAKSKKDSEGSMQKVKPALTPEAKENEMIALATKEAERRLRDGTASPQIIVHYLKLGSTKTELEREKLKAENKLLHAKTDYLESNARVEELFNQAMTAFGIYSGKADQDVENSEDLYRTD